MSFYGNYVRSPFLVSTFPVKMRTTLTKNLTHIWGAASRNGTRKTHWERGKANALTLVPTSLQGQTKLKFRDLEPEFNSRGTKWWKATRLSPQQQPCFQFYHATVCCTRWEKKLRMGNAAQFISANWTNAWSVNRWSACEVGSNSPCYHKSQNSSQI